MARRFLMVLLGIGAVAGFASGFAHLCHGPFGHYGMGPGGRWDRQSDFERHVADTCADAALRVYSQKSPPGPKP
jgi:hypothetical protein